MSYMDNNEIVSQTECLICSVNEIPDPVNGADIAELTDVMQEGFKKIEYLLYRHLPLRKKLWWRLTDRPSKRD
jgi:hypothetical protein